MKRTLLLLLALPALLVPVSAAAAAAGDPLRQAVRNPGVNGAIRAETQIIAETSGDSYATRQSNKGTGGGAIYGCRSPLAGSLQASIACVHANNLANGVAFDFRASHGNTLGILQAGPSLSVADPNARPFVTNATAVATGLNADRVDGMNAAEIIKAAQSGQPAPSAPSAPACRAGTVASSGSCIETSPRAPANFADASVACGAAGGRLPTASELIAARTNQALTLGSAEATSNLLDVTNGSRPVAYATVARDGGLQNATLDQASPYRCVFPTS